MNKHVDGFTSKPLRTEKAGVIVTRVGVNLGAEISGVDLTGKLSDAQFEAINEALVEHALVIFHDQDISSANLMDFGRRFGELTVHPFAPNEGKNAPELIKFRNDETTPPFGTDVWHSDETFRAEPPMATILCAKEVPAVGGDTMFVSMAAAYDGLSEKMQQYISGLEGIHDMKPFRPLFGKSEEERKTLQHFEIMYPPVLHRSCAFTPFRDARCCSSIRSSPSASTAWTNVKAASCSTRCSIRRWCRSISTVITGSRTRLRCGTTARRSTTPSTTTIRSAATWSA